MKKYFLLYLLAASIFLGHYVVSGHAVYGDGIDYWAYLHSWYFDRDINFENEFKHNYSPKSNNMAIEVAFDEIVKSDITVTGKVNNFHPPGTALILFPAYVLADWIAPIKNGYSDAYQVMTGLWAMGLAVLGARICEMIAYRLTGLRNESRWAAIIIFLASPMLYYGSYDVLNSHFASFLISAVFWLVLLSDIENKWLYTGIVIGLAGLTRLQDLLLLIPALVYGFKKKWGLLAVVSVIMSPMAVQWWSLYGRLYPR